MKRVKSHYGYLKFCNVKKHILHHVCVEIILFFALVTLLVPYRKNVCLTKMPTKCKQNMQGAIEQPKLQRNYFLESCHMVFKASNRQTQMLLYASAQNINYKLSYRVCIYSNERQTFFFWVSLFWKTKHFS